MRPAGLGGGYVDPAEYRSDVGGGWLADQGEEFRAGGLIAEAAHHG